MSISHHSLAIPRVGIGALATTLLVGVLLSGVPSQTVAADPPSAPPARYDRDGDGEIGEATAIRERARLYRQRHGRHGSLTAADMLRRTEHGYKHWLTRSRRIVEKGVVGNGWISLGPTNGAGRCSAVAPHPTQTGTVLAGAAGGGVWRTTDAGLSWYPLTDGLADLSVGALAYAPSDPSVVYLGTGEGGYAIDFIPGIGLLRSEDGGDTWFLPSDSSEIVASQFFALSIHPNDPDSLLAATNKGLFSSSDGGMSWQPRLCDSGLAAVTEVLRSPSDPDLVLAALWCKGICPDGLDRVMRSHDGGITWVTAGSGLPPTREIDTELNRNGLTIAPSDDRILYLGMTDFNTDGVGVSRIFRSNNHGRAWQETGYEGNYLGAQGWYDNTLTVHPDNPQVVIAGGIWYEISRDGGATWTTVNPYDSGQGMGTDTIPHVDGHDLQWQSNTLWLACDGGIWMSPDSGATWSARNTGLVTRQYYGMSLDPMDTSRILAGTQDNETNLRLGPGTDSWVHVINGDGFECAINPLVPEIMYGTMYSTIVYRNMSGGAGEWAEISPPRGSGLAPFITPLLMRQDTPWVLYTGDSAVWRSDDGGDHWNDLSTTVVNGSWTPKVINSIAITPADPRVLLVGKEENLYGTRNGGETWRHLIAFGTRVNNLEISPFDADIAIACLAQNDPGSPQLMRTTDGGDTWHAADSGIPPFPTQVARWDPTDSSVVYVGTDLGLYRSEDGGMTWQEFGDGLPAASVHDLRILPDGSKLAVATHGRGIWELNIPASLNSRPSISITSHADGSQVTLGDSIPFTAEASDPDGDELTVTWILDRPWQALAGGSGTGTLSSQLDHVYDWRDSHLVAAHVEDGRGGSASATIRVDALEPADHCETPKVIPGSGPFPYHILTENWHATNVATDPVPPCVDTSSDDTSGRWGSLWFEMTPVETNSYTVSTCGSAQDTVLSVWRGPRCGPYITTYSCNDDDERAHCWGDRTNSYLEVGLEAGITYRFMVGGWGKKWRGRIELHVDCPTCSNRAAGYRYLIPAAAHATGSGNTSWVTDVDLFNAADRPVATEISFLLEGSSGDPISLPLSIPAGTVFELPDIIMTLLGSSGSGAVDIVAEEEIVVTSRTSNQSIAGVFGQGIPSEPSGEALAPGGSHRLIGLASSADRRSNIGMVNLDAAPASLRIELLDEQGEVLTTLYEQLPAHAWRQRNRVLAGVRGTGLAAASALVNNTSSDARVLVYASVVDEHTGDPSYQRRTDEATPATPLWIPVVAHTAGVGSAAWRSDLVLANTGEVALTATVELLANGSASERPSFSVPLAAGVSTLLPDVLDTQLGVSGAGALRISIDAGRLQATSRTYTASGDGSYGQTIPGVLLERGVQLGESALLLQLRNDWDYRTNIGLVNPTDRQLLITAETFTVNGESLGNEVYTLPPNSWLQDNGAVPKGCSYAVLRSTSIGSRFFAYASVVNNRSDDPVYTLAVRQ